MSSNLVLSKRRWYDSFAKFLNTSVETAYTMPQICEMFDMYASMAKQELSHVVND